MSVQPTPINTDSLKKAYNEVNTEVKKLNRSVTFHNITTVAKTTLVYMTIFATGLITAVASMMMLGVSFPAAISIKVLVGLSIGFAASMIFRQTFGQFLFNRVHGQNVKFFSQLNRTFNKNVIFKYHMIIDTLFENARLLNRRSFSHGYKIDDFGIKKVKIDSYDKVEARFKKNEENHQRRIEAARKIELQKPWLLSRIWNSLPSLRRKPARA